MGARTSNSDEVDSLEMMVKILVVYLTHLQGRGNEERPGDLVADTGAPALPQLSGTLFTNYNIQFVTSLTAGDLYLTPPTGGHTQDNQVGQWPSYQVNPMSNEVMNLLCLTQTSIKGLII